MKWQVVITLAAVAAIFTGATLVKQDRSEKAANETFTAAVREGDRVYGEVCGRCHGRYDPRFYLYERWKEVVEKQGCPEVAVEMTEAEREAVKDFLRAKAAPTEDEAETIRERERERLESLAVHEGARTYAETCATCHAEAYFPRTRTPAGWREALSSLEELHGEAEAPVEVAEGKREALAAYLEKHAAGTEEDADIIRDLLDRKPSDGDDCPAEVPTEIFWNHDYEAGMEEAREKKLPVIINFTELSGG